MIDCHVITPYCVFFCEKTHLFDFFFVLPGIFIYFHQIENLKTLYSLYTIRKFGLFYLARIHKIKNDSKDFHIVKIVLIELLTFLFTKEL